MDISKPDKAGWLTKQGGLVPSWKKRWFVLKGATLNYYQAKTDQTSKGQIEIDGASIQPADYKKIGKKNCLEISTNGRLYYIYANSKEDCDEWQKILTKAANLDLSSPSKPPQTDDHRLSRRDSLLQLVNNAATGTQPITITVHGMHCERCVQQIHNTLSTNATIASYNVDLDKEIITVSGKLDINNILESIEQLGFLATLGG